MNTWCMFIRMDSLHLLLNVMLRLASLFPDFIGHQSFVTSQAWFVDDRALNPPLFKMGDGFFMPGSSFNATSADRHRDTEVFALKELHCCRIFSRLSSQLLYLKAEEKNLLLLL